MPNRRTTTLDLIHAALGRLGYVDCQFGVTREQSVLYGVYRKGEQSVVVSWCHAGTVYQLCATTDASAHAIGDALVRSGLTCSAGGTRLDVYGHEHIDAEVRRMLARPY